MDIDVCVKELNKERPQYTGIQYYSDYDLSTALCCDSARQLLDNVDDKTEMEDVNKLIELFNACCILRADSVSKEIKQEYEEKTARVEERVARFFRGITDEEFLECYSSVALLFVHNFWSLVEKYHVYDLISGDTFKAALYFPDTTLGHILSNKEIVKKYDKTISEYMRHSSQSVRILTKCFLERQENSDRYYIPQSLTPDDRAEILERYICSDNPNLNIVRLIIISPHNSECPISSELIQKAKEKEKEVWKNRDKVSGFNYGIKVFFAEQKDIISYERNDGNEYSISYSRGWIRENIDYPTLLNNFIYLFGYTDLMFRCSFVSEKSMIGNIEY